MKLTWLLALAALSALGCSEDDLGTLPPVSLPECPEQSYELCDIRVAACQTQLMALSACVYGSDDPPEVPVHVVSEGTFRAQLELELGKEQQMRTQADEQARQVAEGALHDLGLVEEGALSDQATIDSIVTMFVGVYIDPETGILLIDRGEPLGSVDANTLLLHEYIHALQDVDYALSDWVAPHATRTDELLAARSIYEGQATYYQFRVGAALLGYHTDYVDFEATFDKLRQDLTQNAIDDPSPYVASSATFPYGFGASLASHAWEERGQGFEKELFEAPPLTTREVMRRALFPDDPSYTELDPIELDPPADTGSYSLLDEDVLGAWTFKLLLAKHGFPFEEHWLGVFADHLWLYLAEDGSSAWLWEVQTNDPDAMDEIVPALVKKLPSTVSIASQGGRIYFASGEGGAPQLLLDAGQAFLDAGATD